MRNEISRSTSCKQNENNFPQISANPGGTNDLATKAEYFAAAIYHALQHGEGGTFHGGGVDFGPDLVEDQRWGGIHVGGGGVHGGLTLVLTWLMAGGGVTSIEGAGKPKVWSSLNQRQREKNLCVYMLQGVRRNVTF